MILSQAWVNCDFLAFLGGGVYSKGGVYSRGSVYFKNRNSRRGFNRGSDYSRRGVYSRKYDISWFRKHPSLFILFSIGYNRVSHKRNHFIRNWDTQFLRKLNKTISNCSKTLGWIQKMVPYMRDPTVASGSFSLKVTIPLVPRGA